MTDIKKGVMDIDTSFNTDSTLIDDSTVFNIIMKKIDKYKFT